MLPKFGYDIYFVGLFLSLWHVRLSLNLRTVGKREKGEVLWSLNFGTFDLVSVVIESSMLGIFMGLYFF